jgi:hypothetical protein
MSEHLGQGTDAPAASDHKTRPTCARATAGRMGTQVNGVRHRRVLPLRKPMLYPLSYEGAAYQGACQP